MTPQDARLLEASEMGNIIEAKAALLNGANANAERLNRLMPLQIAVSNGDVEMARLLIENGADVESGGDWHRLPINSKIPLENALDIAMLLIQNGARFGYMK